MLNVFLCATAGASVRAPSLTGAPNERFEDRGRPGQAAEITTAAQSFITAMNDALARADRVVAVFSAAYFELEQYTAEEWSSSPGHVPGGANGKLAPVRVEDIPPGKVPPLLRPLPFRAGGRRLPCPDAAAGLQADRRQAGRATARRPAGAGWLNTRRKSRTRWIRRAVASAS